MCLLPEDICPGSVVEVELKEDALSIAHKLISEFDERELGLSPEKRDNILVSHINRRWVCPDLRVLTCILPQDIKSYKTMANLLKAGAERVAIKH